MCETNSDVRWPPHRTRLALALLIIDWLLMVRPLTAVGCAYGEGYKICVSDPLGALPW